MKKKNLLFVFADQWRRSSCGVYNDDPVLTPHMCEFAKDACVCDNAISTFPLCTPARASLLTGRYPQHTGLFTNCKNGSDINLKTDEVCISDVLNANGYQTGYIGKWHLDEPEINNNANPASGAEGWDAYTPPGIRRHGFDFWYAYNACDNHLHPHYWKDSAKPDVYDAWSPVVETDVALKFIEQRDESRPFCLFVSWNPPHSPYDTAPQKYKDLYSNLDFFRKNVDVCDLQNTMHHTLEKVPFDENSAKALQRDYFAAVTGLDNEFGRLLNCIKSRNLLEDTVICLTADHGDMLLSHSLIGKHVWFEESIGVPFLIGGGGIPASRCSTVFGSESVPVTLLSILGIGVPKEMEGQDISGDILYSRSANHSYTFIESTPGRDVFIKEFANRGVEIRNYGWRGVRTERYTYVIDVGYSPDPKVCTYLFDNVKDPLQICPLRDGELIGNSVADELKKLLFSWLKKESDGFLEIVANE